MHPLLIKLGPIPIHTYGFLIAVGFLAALFVIRKLAERDALNVEKVLDLCFWSLVVGLVGARLLFIITRLNYFISDPIAIFKMWEGGLVFLGGPIAVVPFVVWYLRKHKLPAWKTMDICVIGLTLAHAFGRLGCFSAGCCYGKPTESFFGVRFQSELVDSSLRGVPLHPTQLYEAFSLVLLFIGLLIVRKKRAFDGQVLLVYFMVYPVLRSIIEVFRGDLIRGFVIEDVLSTSQFISILVFIAASVALFIRVKQVKAEGSAKPIKG
jgi:phosphatidylglycerol:prolipoprotein diacylglycerol transferase